MPKRSVSAKSLPKSGNLFKHLRNLPKDPRKFLAKLELEEKDLEAEEGWTDWLLGMAKEYGPKLLEYLPVVLGALV